MNRKNMVLVLGAMGGAVALGAGAYMVWNSRRLRTMRAAKRAGQILYKTGVMMQAMSGVVE